MISGGDVIVHQGLNRVSCPDDLGSNPTGESAPAGCYRICVQRGETFLVKVKMGLP